MRVVIVRDRKSSGGGVHNYYCAISEHLLIAHEFVNVGRAHSYYPADGGNQGRRLPTALRLCLDWACLLLKMRSVPNLIHLNPGLDINTRRSLRRDAVNLLIAKLFRRKVLVFWRGWHNDACGAPEFPGGNNGWLSRVYRMADAHIVLASDFRDDLRRWGFTMPIYLETTVVADSLMELQVTGFESDDDERFRIMFLSRVEITKGVFEMLNAFALLEAQNPGKYQLTIAGDGPDLDNLKRRASVLGLMQVEFKGYVEGLVKAGCYANADVFCFLSYTEGMPNAVLEAMAIGLPLVSSAAGGLKDILEEGVTGYLVPYNRSAEIGHRFRVNEIADRIERLAANEDIRRRMANHNRCCAREWFSAKRVAARLDTIYRQVLGCKSKQDVQQF